MIVKTTDDSQQEQHAWRQRQQRQQQRKAVEIFDRGELNGKTIEVSMER